MPITREELMHALAQAYCHDRNSHKEMDIDLVVAMADEVTKALEKHGGVSAGEDANEPE